MSSPAGTYALSSSELPAVRTPLAFQSRFGPGSAPLTTDDVDNYFKGMLSLANVYRQVQDPQLEGWFKQLFELLMETQTVYKQPVPALYIAYAYASFCNTAFTASEDWIGFWYAFVHGYEPHYSPPLGPWCIAVRESGNPPFPLVPSIWTDTTWHLLVQWGASPPSNIINPALGTTGGLASGYSAREFELSVLKNWTDFPQLPNATLPVWRSQAQAMQGRLHEPSLNADAYYFLLHLLLALLTGDTDCQTLAKQIVNAEANSPERPNDIFINQLVYLTLMYFADPMGAFGWNNSQLQGALSDLKGFLLNTDPTSATIKTSLALHAKILNSDSAYPMHDPYNPDVDFNQRQTDTLAALDQARRDLVKGSAS
jgi:hypothetical protein